MDLNPNGWWPIDLSEKARKLLARKFVVGRVRAEAEHREPGDEAFIGAEAIDLETIVTIDPSAQMPMPLHALGQAGANHFIAALNRLAKEDLIVGTRQPLEIRRIGGGAASVTMRIMCAPGKIDVVRERFGAMVDRRG